MYETLKLDIEGKAAFLTLNRPKKLNAIDETMMNELREAIQDVDAREDVHVVVLRGEGRAFSAGADLTWSEAMGPKERVEHNRIGQKTFQRIEEMGTPVIAAVHGYCLGGALELVLATDFIVCSDDAKLGLPEITLSADPPYRPKITEEEGDPDQPEYGGIVPGWGAVKRLPELVGKARAKEIMFTGVQLDATRAFQLGLVNHVYPADEFEDEVAELARRIGAMNRYNLRLIKELVTKGYDMLEMHPS